MMEAVSGSQDVVRQLREVRRVMAMLTRVCRQTLTYLQGQSAMDEKKMQKLLRDSIRDSERILGE